MAYLSGGAEGGGGGLVNIYKIMRRHRTASSATATKKLKCGARGMGTKRNQGARTAGGRRGVACATKPRPSVDVRAIDTATATPPWQRRQSNATRMPSARCWRQSNAIAAGTTSALGGGARGRPRRNASAARRVARRISTPPLPLLNGGEHTRSRHHQGNDERRGGGRRGTRATTRLTPPVDARAIDAV
jgi:hypothetical protein